MKTDAAAAGYSAAAATVATMQSMASTRGPLAALVLLGFCALGCGGFTDFSAPLPNGYLLHRTNSATVMIAGPGTMGPLRVAPRIDALAVSGDLVVGLAAWVPSADVPAEAGYFVLDTRTGAVRSGLSEGDWGAALRTHGLMTPPPLKSVSAFDTSMFGRAMHALSVVVVAAFAIVAASVLLKRLRNRREARSVGAQAGSR
jgi:hypothetical protein